PRPGSVRCTLVHTRVPSGSGAVSGSVFTGGTYATRISKECFTTVRGGAAFGPRRGVSTRRRRRDRRGLVRLQAGDDLTSSCESLLWPPGDRRQAPRLCLLRTAGRQKAQVYASLPGPGAGKAHGPSRLSGSESPGRAGDCRPGRDRRAFAP